MESTAVTKVCPKCGTEKPASEFGKANRRDGLRSYCKECEKARKTADLSRIKEEIYNRLGHVCCHCGFADKRALQIDHVNGGGNKEHKEITNAYCFLKKVAYDTSGSYQLLCANCNWIKRMERREHALDKKISDEGMRKIKEANEGKVVSIETRQKMSDSHKGQTPWNKGELTEAQKILMHETALKREAARTPEQRSASAAKREANKREKRLAA